MANDEAENLRRLSVFLRVYGALSLVIFGSLLLGFAVKTPLLADEPRGALNWLIWNGVRCGNEPCHVPPMLFVIYLAWAAFFFLAARKPLAYRSFLSFTHVGEPEPWRNHDHASSDAPGPLLEEVFDRHTLRCTMPAATVLCIVNGGQRGPSAILV